MIISENHGGRITPIADKAARISGRFFIPCLMRSMIFWITGPNEAVRLATVASAFSSQPTATASAIAAWTLVSGVDAKRYSIVSPLG